MAASTQRASGGGPHVLACAALLPDLVTSAATLASLAPADAEGLDWFEGMGQENVYHTYSAYARGCGALWSMWQWLDRAPLGRNEGHMSWFHRHDEYPA